MSANGTKNDQDVLVCHADGLDSCRSADKAAVSKIPSDLPQWKQELLRKKEKERMEKHEAEVRRLYEESQTPEWMRPLKKLHQRRKSEQSEKEEAKRRKAEEERQRFEAMPAWKKQLIYKKRAKSADSLLHGCDVKNLNISEDKKSKTVNSECKQNKETVENNEVNAESDAGTNGVDHGNEISDQKQCDEDIASKEVETTAGGTEKKDEQNKEAVEDSEDDGEQAVYLGENEDEIAEKIDDAGDPADSEQKEDISGEESENNESAIESSQNSSEACLSIRDDNEEENLLLDEDGLSENEEQQVEASSEATEEKSNDKE